MDKELTFNNLGPHHPKKKKKKLTFNKERNFITIFHLHLK